MFLTHLSILLSQALLIFLKFVLLLQNSFELVLYILGAGFASCVVAIAPGYRVESLQHFSFLLLYEKKVVILMNLSLSSFYFLPSKFCDLQISFT